MKCLRQKFKAYMEISLSVRERTLVFRDMSTPDLTYWETPLPHYTRAEWHLQKL